MDRDAERRTPRKATAKLTSHSTKRKRRGVLSAEENLSHSESEPDDDCDEHKDEKKRHQTFRPVNAVGQAIIGLPQSPAKVC